MRLPELNKQSKRTLTSKLDSRLPEISTTTLAIDVLVSPVSRKLAWKKNGFEKVKLERNADNSGREFFFGGGGLKPWKKTGRKICRKKSPSEFAEKFAGNFPKIRQARIKNSPRIRSAEPWAQDLASREPNRYGRRSMNLLISWARQSYWLSRLLWELATPLSFQWPQLWLWEKAVELSVLKWGEILRTQ